MSEQGQDQGRWWWLIYLQAEKLQHDLDDMGMRMQGLENQLRQAESLKNSAQEKKDQIVQLKNQLEGEKLQRYEK